MYEDWNTAGKRVFSRADQRLSKATDWRIFFKDFLIEYEDVGFSAKLESRLIQAMGVYAELRRLEQDYTSWANAKMTDYIHHFAPKCTKDRATAMASMLLEWDAALANQEITHTDPVQDLIIDKTHSALLYLLQECIEGPHA